MNDQYTPQNNPNPASGTDLAPEPGLDKLAPGLGLGAANGLLFNLPEAAINALGGEKTRQIVQAYKAAHPEFGAGEMAGTVGSMLIPGGTILKGLGAGADALGAGRIAAGLTKAGDVAGGSLGLKQGLTAAAEQAVPRAAAEQVNNGGDTGQTLQDLGTNVALGGAIGTGGQLLGKGLKALGDTGIGKTIKDEVEKTLQDAILSGADVNTGAITKQMNDQARRLGLNKVGNMFNNVEDLKAKTADFIVNNGLLNKVKREEFLSDQSPLWQKVADDYNAKPIDFTDQGVLDSVKADPNVQDYINRTGVGESKVDDLILNQAMDLSKRPDFNQSKSYLTDQGRLGNKAGTELGDAQKAVADTMHDMIDAHAMDLSPELAQLKSDYPVISLLKRASGKEQSLIENPLKEGSDTFQKLATNAALGGAVGGATSSDENRVGGAVGGALLAPLLSRPLAKLGTQGMSQLAAGGMKIANNPALLKAINPILAAEKGGGALASQIASQNQAPDNQVPMMEPQSTEVQSIPASQTAPAPGQPVNPGQASQPMNQGQSPVHPLDPYLQRAWQLEDPQGLIENARPGSRQVFMDSVKKNLTNSDGSINYGRAGNLMFPDNPEDSKRFTESYNTMEKIQKGLPNAVRLVSINNPKADADKQSVIGAVSEVLTKNQGMKDEQAQKTVKGILENPLRTAQEKGAIIMNLLRTADPMSYGKGGVLERAGMLK
jgi:hypothetical protein